MADFYTLLGVQKHATSAEIKTAYRKMAQKWHPDRHPENEKEGAAKKFQDVKNAYTILSDETKRRDYNRFGDPSSEPPKTTRTYYDSDDTWMHEAHHRARPTFEDVFRDFSDFSDSRDSNVILPCSVSFVDAELGGSLSSTYRGKPLTVKVPPSSRDGALLPTNILFVKAQVMLTSPPHISIYHSDLTVKTPLPFAHALAGCTYEFKHWLGSTLSVQWPPGTHTGKKLRLKGHGLSGVYQRGDLYLEAVVSTEPPSALIEEAQKLIRTTSTLSPHVSWQ
jgi:DnaJ-class molecular chaperone